MTKPTLNIGLIGSGFMGQAHADAFRRARMLYPNLPMVPHLYCLADANDELAAKAAARFGFETSTGDWRKMINDPKVDVVDITSPNHLHCEMALAGEMNEPGAMHADFFDRIQGAARPERERGLKASWRRLRVRLRRLLDRDTATLRRDRARARVAAFRESEPVSEQEIPFEGGTLAHYHAARAAEAGSGQ